MHYPTGKLASSGSMSFNNTNYTLSIGWFGFIQELELSNFITVSLFGPWSANHYNPSQTFYGSTNY